MVVINLNIDCFSTMSFSINCFLSLSAFLVLLSGDCCGNKARMSLYLDAETFRTLCTWMDLSKWLSLLSLLLYIIFEARHITFKTFQGIQSKETSISENWKYCWGFIHCRWVLCLHNKPHYHLIVSGADCPDTALWIKWIKNINKANILSFF